ncbi:MAG: 50S ribosomal protein L9 [Candidatus Taylorbacteria bacterium]|nr:50S ribosomal protein L9 [Candidatus Taylorbacteria bacterium]
MKVILLKDVAKVGKKYETKIVSDGFALNSLIPKGLAQVATPAFIKSITLLKANEDAEKKIQEDLLMKNLKDLEGIKVEMIAKANEKGHLFAGIHNAEIAPEITKQTRLIVSPEFIKLDKPIKEIGDHKITVEVQGKTVAFTLTIKAK